MTEETPTAAAPIACGVAGWSYPDWDGYVYPSGLKDKLSYLAPFFDVIEINSTFYRPPEKRLSRSWAERVTNLPDFHFTAKLHQDVTHRGLIEPEMVRAFHEGLEPLTQAGRLRHLLAQFRYDFADSPDTRRHLDAVADRFGGIGELTLELRNHSWQMPDALQYLGSLHVNVANLDYPAGHDGFTLRTCTVGSHAYLRLHGRNAKAWYSSGAGRDETYNYLYSTGEIRDIAQRALELARRSSTLTVIANNHYQGKEAVNALELRAMLQTRPVPVPPLLKQRYPQLEAIASPVPGQLL